ncbi:DUF3575 domain-containing protein [Maribacter sp. 2308TA10-17]|uniref:DUF3575 domain-containing protein n=1 Tax=Maribacter sp. 2308TA10-17 TaxID=3386276 RepID=UPI0039BCA2EB
MIKPKFLESIHKLSFLLFLLCSISSYAQEKRDSIVYKNQVSTNLMLPIFESFDFNYERTVANKWAIGLAGAVYGERGSDLSTGSSYFEYKTIYEIMPYMRLYFQGAQNKSHFVELFGSISQVEETGRVVRTVNDAGFGVYQIGTKTYSVGGLGAGYGYRFLFLDKRLVLEAQFGIRTNFNVDFYFLNGAVVRTGIRVGYRF